MPKRSEGTLYPAGSVTVRPHSSYNCSIERNQAHFTLLPALPCADQHTVVVWGLERTTSLATDWMAPSCNRLLSEFHQVVKAVPLHFFPGFKEIDQLRCYPRGKG